MKDDLIKCHTKQHCQASHNRMHLSFNEIIIGIAEQYGFYIIMDMIFKGKYLYLCNALICEENLISF